MHVHTYTTVMVGRIHTKFLIVVALGMVGRGGEEDQELGGEWGNCNFIYYILFPLC